MRFFSLEFFTGSQPIQVYPNYTTASLQRFNYVIKPLKIKQIRCTWIFYPVVESTGSFNILSQLDSET